MQKVRSLTRLPAHAGDREHEALRGCVRTVGSLCRLTSPGRPHFQALVLEPRQSCGAMEIAVSGKAEAEGLWGSPSTRQWPLGRDLCCHGESLPASPLFSVLGIRKRKHYNSMPVTTQGMPGTVTQAGHHELQKATMCLGVALPVVG